MSTITYDPTTTEDVQRLLADMYDAFGTGDASSWSSQLCGSHEPHGIGTDPNEFWSGREQLSSVFDAQVAEMHAAGITFQAGDAVIQSSGDVAWVADQPTLRINDDVAIPLRLTVVLVRENGRWNMAQFHLSLGVPNESMLDTTLTI